MITAIEAEALARLDRHLHAKYDPEALGNEAEISYDIDLQAPGRSPWIRVHAHVAYAHPTHDNEFAIWRHNGDVYEVQHQEVIDEDGPLIPLGNP